MLGQASFHESDAKLAFEQALSQHRYELAQEFQSPGWSRLAWYRRSNKTCVIFLVLKGLDLSPHPYAPKVL